MNEDSFENLLAVNELCQNILSSTIVTGDISQSVMSESSKFYLTYDMVKQGIGLHVLIGCPITCEYI